MLKAHELFLQELMRVPGVKDVMLVNNRGEVLLGVDKPISINIEDRNQTGIITAQMIGGAELIYSSVDEISILFKEDRIIAITNLDIKIESSYGTQEVFLVIVSSSNANLPTIRLAVKVAANRLKMDKNLNHLQLSTKVNRSDLLTKKNLNETNWNLISLINEV